MPSSSKLIRPHAHLTVRGPPALQLHQADIQIHYAQGACQAGHWTDRGDLLPRINGLKPERGCGWYIASGRFGPDCNKWFLKNIQHH